MVSRIDRPNGARQARSPLDEPRREHYTVLMSASEHPDSSLARRRRTRLAPSPTGGLHLGNARTFALTWALARNEGWDVLLRIEDLDLSRVRSGAIEETEAILAWLGLDHDGPVAVQSADLAPYRAAMIRLAAAGAVYRCARSRKDVRMAASAPHADDHEQRFPPELRPGPDALGFVDERSNHRLRVEPGPERVWDQLLGERCFDPGTEVGDFLVWTKLGVPSYQLAVVVDDLRHGITDVVRGDDLLASAARQQILHRLLGARDGPRWWHLPLVYGADGERLAKRRDHTSVAALRAAGVRRERILGLLARWCGFVADRCELSVSDFRGLVRADTLRAFSARCTLPEGRTLATELDLRWLTTAPTVA
jgi:glutamyl-tRNA synthetase